MKTFQDLEKAISGGSLTVFIAKAIDEYRASPEYNKMVEAEAYYDGENVNIMNLMSEIKSDNSNIEMFARIRIPSGVFGRIVTQLVNRLWFNAVQLDTPPEESKLIEAARTLIKFLPKSISTAILKALNIEGKDNKKKLGKNFDKIVKDIATNAAVHGVCYGFWNLNIIQMFSALNYLPLPDEETGSHKAGISFWQLAPDKPWRIRLFEIDGYTKFSRDEGKEVVLTEKKRTYKIKVRKDTLGEQIIEGENYPGFPVLPMYANSKHRTELTTPIKAKIDLYDAILTSFGDDVMRTRLVYWVLKGYSGDIDTLNELRSTIQRLGIIAPTDDTEAKPTMTEIPADGVLTILDRLESEIYRDAGVMNNKEIMGGSLTNVAIQTAQIGEKMKVSDMEWNGADFIDRLLILIGVENESITFKHETVSNDMEITQRLAMYTELDLETKLMIDPLFSPEMIKEILDRVENQALGLDRHADDDNDNPDDIDPEGGEADGRTNKPATPTA